MSSGKYDPMFGVRVIELLWKVYLKCKATKIAGSELKTTGLYTHLTKICLVRDVVVEHGTGVDLSSYLRTFHLPVQQLHLMQGYICFQRTNHFQIVSVPIT